MNDMMAWRSDGLTQIIADELMEVRGSDTAKSVMLWMRGNIRCDRCVHSKIETHWGYTALYCELEFAHEVNKDHYCKEFTR